MRMSQREWERKSEKENVGERRRRGERNSKGKKTFNKINVYYYIT